MRQLRSLYRHQNGEYYRIQDETVIHRATGIYPFYVCYRAENSIKDIGSKIAWYSSQFNSIRIFDEEGNEVEKESRVYQGYSLKFKLGDQEVSTKLSFIEDCIDVTSDAPAFATGKVHCLIIPYVFSDYVDTKEEELAKLKGVLGRILEGNETVDYSNEISGLSFSEYYDIASYGKLSVDSFITDYYYDERTYESCYSDSIDYRMAKIIEPLMT